jgi:hypothetical protein
MTALEDRAKIMQLTFGAMAAQAVGTAARLGLADVIGDGTRSAGSVAASTGTEVGATTRLLRALAALELLTETGDGFALTPLGTLLRRDRPDSVHAVATMFTDTAMLGGWLRLDDAIRTGDKTFDDVFGTDFFSHLKEKPELSATFNASMSAGTRLTAAVLPDHYPFDRFTTVADIGGGDGTLLAAILGKHPGLRGLLYDTEEGLAQADVTLTGYDVTTRTGDFFTEVPGGADLYLIKSILHDWDDDRCVTILRNCRAVIPPHGRLLILEPVLPEVVDGSMPPIMYLSDLNMLVNLGGKERTRAEFEALCEQSGFELTNVIPLPPPVAFSVLEASPRESGR